MKQKLEKWLRWLESIKDEVRELVETKYIYTEILDIIEKNPNLNKEDNLFYAYLGRTYASHTAMGVRRQIKSKENSISIVRLFEEMISTPEVLSRKNYINMYEPTLDWANNDFNQFTSSPDSEHIDPNLVEIDRNSLREASFRPGGFADKHVAHRDKKRFEEDTTFNDVDLCIDLLEKQYIKYHKLFHAEVIDTLLPEPPHDWKKIFHVPWLSSTTKTSTNKS